MAVLTLSVAIICLTALISQLLYYRFKRERTAQMSVAEVLAHLEKELASIKDLTAKVEQLRLGAVFKR